MTQPKTRKPRRTYTDEFKNQLVQLYLNGKRKCDIVREYDISPVYSNLIINGSAIEKLTSLL